MNALRCISLAGALSLTVAVAAPSARAASDFKFIAPVDCEPYAPNTLASELQITPTGIYNPGTSVERVLCPIPRDQDDDYLTNDVQVVAYYRSLGAGAALTCTLYVGSTSMHSAAVTSYTVSGPAVAYGARNKLIINGATQTDQFAVVPANVICALGPKTSLAGLFLDEAGPTNVP